MPDDLRADCIGGGYAYAGHGDDCVMIAFTSEVGWWRNSAWFKPADARAIAGALLRQADAAESVRASDESRSAG